MSRTQLGGFILSNFIGLAIVVIGLQLYTDVRSIWEDEDSFIKKEFLVINKKVTSSGVIDGGDVTFDESEITDIKSQPWVRRVGLFSSNRYKLYASVSAGDKGLSTYMFFESVPSDFIDVSGVAWTYRPGDREVPIILSKDYLSLYNFGFAKSSGMPKITEGMLGAVPLSLTVIPDNDGVPQEFIGKIVGFSSRINTILVPEEFLKWSNEEYGSGYVAKPSRIILDVSSPGDVRIADYLESNGMESSGKESSSSASYFLNIGVGVVLAVGGIISLLSFFILLLSISLLLQKNREKIYSLLMLGYDLYDVGVSFHRMVIICTMLSYMLANCAMLAVRSLYKSDIAALGGCNNGLGLSLVGGGLLTLLMISFNLWSVSRRVRYAFRL